METAVNRIVNRWTAVFGWTVMMLIVWSLFVPRGLSVGSFVLLCLAGPLLLVAGAMFWNAQRPSPSIRQIRATLDSDERSRAGTQASR